MFNQQFYSGKKVLVTGHTGFKGTWLCKMLIQQGAEVCGYALEPLPHQKLFAISRLEEQMQSVYGDIRDEQKLWEVFNTFQPEIVIHLVAQPIVKESYLNPKYTYETNVLGTLYLMECIRKTPTVKSVLNVTTEKVYENKEQPGVFIDETFPLDGYDPYSNSKSCSEFVTQTYRRCFFMNTDCAISTARTSNTIGGGDFSPHRIIADCVQAAAEHKQIIVRNPDSTRPYQYVLEPLAVYLNICEKQYYDKCFEGSYNVAPDTSVSASELVSIFCQKWGDGLSWLVQRDNGPYEASILSVSNQKLKSVLNWHPKYDFETTIEKIVAWEKQYIQAPEHIAAHMEREITDYLKAK